MDKNHTLEKVKTIHRVRQDIYNLYNWKSLIFKIKDLLQINMRKDGYLNGKQANDLTRHFVKEEIKMFNKHLKMCLS